MSFTPENEIETPKRCVKCQHFLSATRFRSQRMTRNEIKGIYRNSKCRNCESPFLSNPKMTIKDLNNKIEDLESHNHEILEDFKRFMADVYRRLERIDNKQ